MVAHPAAPELVAPSHAPADAEVGPSANYRKRLTDGLAQALVTTSYRDVTIADIVRNAHTSRRTFYKEFRDRDHCYFTLLRSVHAGMMRDVAEAVDLTADWRDQVEQAIGAYFRSVAANPAVIRSWVRELPSLGDPTVTGQGKPRDEFAALLVGLTRNEALRRAGIKPASEDLARFLVGGIQEMTAMVVEHDRPIEPVIEVVVSSTIALLMAGSGEG
ncbi:TetR/AcrR family transcriptional regulator [Williamsia sp. CHRR-6]|uniref:TetR/AcrR family transcriptional regulator n=1 Tax=Williamsia sp. CHRR-6 TaxID=2835871 RepID=UPI001BDA0DFF|nr:TetR/AcrR family transcriptional regulator [Williamsia sp. CHRR-6]MBT0567785.1 TetR/AcrR family transcriptional regulator [Williamsia sp. CHRR-6]